MTPSDRRRFAGTLFIVSGCIVLLVTLATGGAGAEESPDVPAAAETPVRSVGGTIWFDDNDNGRIDAEEAGIAGVRVVLHADANRDGAPDGYASLGEVATGADGSYAFAVDAGSWVVRIPDDEWGSDRPMFGCRSSAPTTLDASDRVDGDDNGYSLPDAGLLAGPATVDDTHPVDTTIDLGCHRPVFDLAVEMQSLASADLDAGTSVELLIDVRNDGTLSAEQLALEVRLPETLTTTDPDWMPIKGGAFLRSIDLDVLRPGLTASVGLTVDILAEGPHELMAMLAAVDSVDRMPNGLGYEELDTELESTLLLGGEGGSAEPDEPAEVSAVAGEQLIEEPTPPAAEDGVDAAQTPDAPKQAVAPEDLVEAVDPEAVPVLALTGPSDRPAAAAGLLLIVVGTGLVLLANRMERARPIVRS